VSALQLGLRRRCAELGLLDAAAARAEEVVVVLRPAADVRRPALAEQRVDAAAGPEQLDRPVRRREPEPRLELPRAIVQLGDREAARRLGHRAHHGQPLCGRPDAVRECEFVSHEARD
jgi:hypothetical protein